MVGTAVTADVVAAAAAAAAASVDGSEPGLEEPELEVAGGALSWALFVMVDLTSAGASSSPAVIYPHYPWGEGAG